MDKILIKNGLVYEPLTHKKSAKNIAISDGTIIEDNFFRPDFEIDAEGCIITPGLIDFHLHCYTEGSDGGSDADMTCLPNGVTTCIDAGTSGTANFKGFYTSVIARSITRVLALLHVAPEGLATGRHPENQNPAFWDRNAIGRLCKAYPEIVGIKVRMGANINDPYGLHDEPLIEAIRLADILEKKVVVHVNDPNVDCGKIASELRPGDVYCHAYAGKRENILDNNGNIKSEVINARERGVLFDACNGRGNFLFSVAEKAISDGFFPDIISTDNNPYGNYKHPIISLPRLLSKYLMFGMDIYDIFDAASRTPAIWLGRPDLASLDAGTEADIAIWKLKDKKVIHKDFTGAQRWGNQILIPELTIRAGVIVYSQSDFL